MGGAPVFEETRATGRTRTEVVGGDGETITRRASSVCVCECACACASSSFRLLCYHQFYSIMMSRL